ncbi:MAG: ribonuclease P protein component [Cytophagales bacterium]|nr:ribonuclease P protein component [Cytophagales bacterium]
MSESRPKSFKFPKVEKLTGKKKIEELFQNGSSIFLHPFLLKFIAVDETVHRVLIAVPKKKIKRAVDRNLIKRRIRESYRLNKHIAYDQPETFYHVGFIYQDTKALSYTEIEKKLVILLKRLQDEKSK